MRRHSVLSILLVAPLVFTASCGDDEPTKKLPPIGSASTTTAKPEEALPTTREKAAKLHVAVLGDNAARTDEEKAAVKAYMTYWQAVSDTYFDVEPAPTLAQSTSGDAAVTVLTYMAKLKSKKQRSVGWTRSNVLSVRVSGASATVKDCIENFSFSVDADDKPLEQPTPFYRSTSTLTERDGKWVVTETSATIEKKSCLR